MFVLDARGAWNPFGPEAALDLADVGCWQIWIVGRCPVFVDNLEPILDSSNIEKCIMLENIYFLGNSFRADAIFQKTGSRLSNMPNLTTS